MLLFNKTTLANNSYGPSLNKTPAQFSTVSPQTTMSPVAVFSPDPRLFLVILMSIRLLIIRLWSYAYIDVYTLVHILCQIYIIAFFL